MDAVLQRVDAPMRPGTCEEAMGGHVVVKPKVWPPRFRMPQSRRAASASVRCLKCEAAVIVYEELPDCVRWATDKDIADAKAAKALAARQAEQIARRPGPAAE